MFIFSCKSPTSSLGSFVSEEKNEDQLVSAVETLTPGGSYDIDVRVASQNNGGTLSLEMDSSTVASSKSFNSTGGWQTWTTMTFSNVSLNAGEQVLRINMVSSGFNLNYIKFSSSENNKQSSDNPYREIDATSFTESSNISVLNGDGGELVNFEGGDTSWISFELDFGSVEPQSVDVRAMDPNWGGNIIVRIDSPTGQEICRIYPSGGGNWSLCSNSTWPRPTGKKTVYILTNNSGMQINTIEFK